MELTDARWRKSSWSAVGNNSCVEVAANLTGIIAVRDSKDPEGPKLVFSPAQWRDFIGGVRTGEFELG